MRRMAQANKKRWALWRKQYQENAKQEFPRLKTNPLFLAGLMLYWGEGDSKMENSMVRLSNIDPKMIRIFSLFLLNICRIPRDKIKVTLILHHDLKEKLCKDFWTKTTGISENQFYKTQFIRGRHPKKRISHGICNIYVASRGLKEKVFIWIKLYQKQLVRV
jgi:hypothetical protein